MNKNSIVEKVDYLLSIARKGSCCQQELDEIEAMIGEHTNHIILGRVFGYSVSDYAIATLAWLNSRESKDAFRRAYDLVDATRQEEINRLIQSEIYLEY